MKYNEYTVSVIIPAYNCEKTIGKCIDSLLVQTYPKVEIIVINDGSTDCTREKLEQYSGQIVVENVINGGVSNARNMGISLAKGQYIVFCDSDDWVDPDYIMNLVKAKDKNGYLVISKYRTVGKEQEICNQIGRNLLFTLSSGGIHDFIDLFNHNVIQAPYCKLFDKEIIDKYNIKFSPDIIWGEDFMFVLDYLDIVGGVKSIENVDYNYCISSGSLTKKITRNHIDSFVKSKNRVIDFLISKNMWDSCMIRCFSNKSVIDYLAFNTYGFVDNDYRKAYKAFKSNPVVVFIKKNAEYPSGKLKFEIQFDCNVYWLLKNVYRHR